MTHAETPSLPSAAIIVATHNRRGSLDTLLDCLLALNYPSDLLEIIFVDDGSDPPVEITTTTTNLRVLRQANAGAASARNVAIGAATAELIAITDDDCRPHPDWLLRLACAYRGDPSALLGGCTENILHENDYASASQMLLSYVYRYFSQHASQNNFFATCNVAAARSRLLEVGGFDESFVVASEDRDLCDRWQAIGPLRYVPEAVVDHAHAMSFRDFLRQHFRYGRSANHLHVKRNARGLVTQVESSGFYRGMFARPFEEQRLLRAMRTSMLLFLAQASSSLGYLYEARLRPKIS